MDIERITTEGQVTIPREIRNRLGLLPHTRVSALTSDEIMRPTRDD